jgi:autotransporter-associated beta strand protein
MERIKAMNTSNHNPVPHNLSRRTSARTPVFALAASLLLVAGGLGAQAQNPTKLNTTTMVNGPTDWSVAPTTTSIGEFGATPSAANLGAMTLGGALTLGGLQFDSTMAGPVKITDANTLTLGASGINSSLLPAADALYVNLACPVTLGASQTWNVGGLPGYFNTNIGVPLVLSGSGLNLNGNILTITGVGSVSNAVSSPVVSKVSGTTVPGTIIKQGPAAFTVPSASAGPNVIGTTISPGQITVDGGLFVMFLAQGSGGQVFANSTANVTLGGGALENFVDCTGADGEFFINLTLTPGEDALYGYRYVSSTSTITFAGTTSRQVGATFFARPYDGARGALYLSNLTASLNVLVDANGSAYGVTGNSYNYNSTSDFYDWGGIGSARQYEAATYTSATSFNLGTTPTTVANIYAGATTITPMAAQTTGAFRDDLNAPVTVNLNGQTWTTGGILIGNAKATAGSIIEDLAGGGMIMAPNLTGSGTVADIVIFVDPAVSTSAQPYTIRAKIADNGSEKTAITKGAAGTLVLNGNNTFTGGVNINDGTILLGGTGALNSSTPNAINFYGSGIIGSVQNTSLYPGGPSAIQGTNGSVGHLAIPPSLALGGNSVTVASLDSTKLFSGLTPLVANSNATPAILTISSPNSPSTTFAGVIQDGALLAGGTGGALSLTKSGTGTQILTGANTYSGATTVNSGTLALSGAGSIGNSSGLNIASGGTLDVSGLNSTSFTVPGSLAASGNSAAQAVIVGQIGGTVSLGSAPVTLTYDGASPALTIAQGTLVLNGNSFTINSANGSPLPNGKYTVVQQTTGNIAEQSGTYPASIGTAIAPGAAASISVSGGNVVLNINVTGVTPVITWANPAPIIYGTPLSASQLDAAANGGLSGVYTYTPQIGTVLPAGTATLSVLFAPYDTDYTSATQTVSLV